LPYNFGNTHKKKKKKIVMSEQIFTRLVWHFRKQMKVLDRDKTGKARHKALLRVARNGKLISVDQCKL